MVDTRLLSGVEVLVAVIETGSFVRAVEALGLSHSTRSLRFIDEGGPLLRGIRSPTRPALGRGACAHRRPSGGVWPAQG